jgi:hypothetical protein
LKEARNAKHPATIPLAQTAHRVSRQYVPGHTVDEVTICGCAARFSTMTQAH